MKSKVFIVISLLIVSNIKIQSQVYQSWVARYTGSQFASGDNPKSIACDSVGNIYVFGYSFNSMTYDYVTVKYNTEGRQVWTAVFSGTNDDIYGEPLAIGVGKSGNIYVSGNYEKSIMVMKYDSSGNKLWTEFFIGEPQSTNKVRSLTIDDDENVYVAGGTRIGIMNYKALILKYDSSSALKWFAIYAGPTTYPSDFANSIAVDNERKVYITGLSAGGSGNTNFATVKFDSNGVREWAARFVNPTGTVDYAPYIAVDYNGNVFIAGTSYSTGTRQNYTTIKYNSSGEQQWISNFNGLPSLDDYVTHMTTDDNSNVYVTGTYYYESSKRGIATIKYSMNGIQEWQALYQTAFGSDFGHKVAADNFGNVYVSGSSMTGPTASDFVTMKYNQTGAEQWNIRYHNSGGDIPADIVLDNFGNIFVTGLSAGTFTGTDYATIKYTQTLTGLNNSVKSVPENLALHQNYPNPFNPVTKIKFDIPSNVKRETSNVSLIIYNSTGEEVRTLVNESLNAGSYEINFDARNYPSGVYYYSLKVNDYEQTKRMMLIK